MSCGEGLGPSLAGDESREGGGGLQGLGAALDQQPLLAYSQGWEAHRYPPTLATFLRSTQPQGPVQFPGSPEGSIESYTEPTPDS